jgi:hypothetical protein
MAATAWAHDRAYPPLAAWQTEALQEFFAGFNGELRALVACDMGW